MAAPVADRPRRDDVHRRLVTRPHPGRRRSDRRVLRRLGRPRSETVDQQSRLGDAEDQLPVQRVLSRRLPVEDDDGAERRDQVAGKRQPQRLQARPARGHRSLLVHAEVPRPEVVRAAQQHAGSVADARVAQHAVLPPHGAAGIARGVRAVYSSTTSMPASTRSSSQWTNHS